MRLDNARVSADDGRGARIVPPMCLRDPARWKRALRPTAFFLSQRPVCASSPQFTMKTKLSAASVSPVTRRSFLKTTAVTTAGLATLSWQARAQINKNSKLRIFQIGVGGIGGMQRAGLKGHPMVEWAGFCDVDQRELDRIKKEHPDAWTMKDYREAFASHVGDFDAVIVDAPDFHHAPMILAALKDNKHVYAQKPLVHQLAELRMVRDA